MSNETVIFQVTSTDLEQMGLGNVNPEYLEQDLARVLDDYRTTYGKDRVAFHNQPDMVRVHNRCGTPVVYDLETQVTPGYFAACLNCDEDVDLPETHEIYPQEV